MLRGRVAQSVALVAVAVALTTGCSIGSAVPEPVESTCADPATCDGWTDFAGMLADWRSTADELALPPGAVMRPPERDDFGGGEQEFSARYGRSIAHTQWFCLWEAELLAQPDPASPAAAAAIEQLRLFLGTDTFAEDYGGDVGVVAMVEEAADGDTARLADDHETNCGE